MKRTDQKSHCAVNFALEAIGDPWSLLIVRDIAFNGKHTFNEFLHSEERIAKNILANRLAQLEEKGIVCKRTNPYDRRVTEYNLTEKGIDLVPVLFALSEWSVKHDPLTDANMAFAEAYYKNPAKVTKTVQRVVHEGRAAFVGDRSAAEELGIG